MNTTETTESKPNRRWIARIWRLATKELRETLRDRRTIVTLVMMPLLVYPILSLVFQNFLMSSLGNLPGDKEPGYVVAFTSNLTEQELKPVLFRISEEITRFEEQNANSKAEVEDESESTDSDLDYEVFQQELFPGPKFLDLSLIHI